MDSVARYQYCISLLLLLATCVTASVLYEGATIISFDDSTERVHVLRNASLLVENDIITQLEEGPILTTVPGNAIRVDASGKIISPGMIDTHHHLWQTQYKTIASNVSLAEYFQRYGEYSPALEHFTPDDVYIGQLMGCLELLYEGTTSVVDHAHASWSNEHVDSTVNATFESGVRSFYAYAIHTLPNDYSWDDQLAKIRSLSQESRFQATSSLVHLGMAYDSFYAAPESNISTLWDLARELDLSFFTLHEVEGPWAIPNSPSLLHRSGWLNETLPVIFSHAAWISFFDANLLRQTNQYISTTPESELHYGQLNPTSHLIQDQASLGLDTHFTFSTSMVQQARMWLQEMRRRNFMASEERWLAATNNPASVEQAFYLMTRAGGLALRRPDLGVLQVGAKADLVVYRTDKPNMAGWSDAVAAVVLHSNVGDIEDVMVGGQFVKRSGNLLYPAYDDVRTRFAASAEKIQRIWAETDWPPLEGAFNDGAGAPYGLASLIDTQRGMGTGY